MREMEVEGRRLFVSDAIRRLHDGWRVKAMYSRPPRYFSDGKEGPLASFAEANSWLDRGVAREPYDMDLTRVLYRKLTLTRRFRTGGPNSSPVPRFDLEISPSRSSERRAWMRIFLGSATTLTQERIDAAIATLHTRWEAYRQQLNQYPRDHVLFSDRLASDVAGILVRAALPEPMRPYPTRLFAQDIRAWNGTAIGVGFSPARTVDPARTEFYCPEAKARSAASSLPVALLSAQPDQEQGQAA